MQSEFEKREKVLAVQRKPKGTVRRRRKRKHLPRSLHHTERFVGEQLNERVLNALRLGELLSDFGPTVV